MASDQPAPENVKLRYKSASVYERSDTHSAEVGQLEPDNAFTVLGTVTVTVAEEQTGVGLEVSQTR